MNTSDDSDVEEANLVQLCRAALKLIPPDDPRHADIVDDLADALWTQFHELGRISDLEEAIQLYRELIKMRPLDHPDRPKNLHDLGITLHDRFEQLGRMPDLEEAIMFHREAMNSRPLGHPDHAYGLSTIASALQVRFEQLGRMSDLEEAVVLHREALKLRPSGHPERSSSLDDLTSALWIQFEQLGTMSSLEESIVLYREYLNLIPSNHHDRSSTLSDLAHVLMTLFEQLGRMSDLEEAIVLDREALNLRPAGHPDRSSSLNNLATTLQIQFKQLGRMSDLEEAILLLREGLLLNPIGHPVYSMSLGNLASALQTQFGQLGRISDLEEALQLQRESLSLTSLDNPTRSNNLNNLSNTLQTIFEQLGRMSHLEEAIVLSREALRLRPPGHCKRLSGLVNLAAALQIRFDELEERQLEEISDLEEANRLLREALLLAVGHSAYSMTLNNLANVVRTQHKYTGKMSDLEEAILLHREALSLRPSGHPHRLSSLNNLAITFQMLISGTKISNEAWENFELASNYIYAPATARLRCTLNWTQKAHQYKHESSRHAYRKSLLLLEQCLIIFPTPELQHNFYQNFQNISDLAIDAVSWAIEIGELKEAVEVWEQGRGILWSKMRDYRYPIEQLRNQNASLAEQFDAITQQLNQLMTTKNAGSQWNDIVKEIQDIPGFETFLRIPSFSSIIRVASEGPVILVNISHHRSDALILYNVNLDPINVPLSDTSKSKLYHIVDILAKDLKSGYNANMDKTIEEILIHLWKSIAYPILQKLDELDFPKGSRIWWCLSGKLCVLPIHAAQPFGTSTISQQELSQKYIHSYTPTLSSLIRAREGVVVRERGTVPKILAMATSSLDKVYEEIEAVQTVGHNTVQKLIGSEVTHSTMMDSLTKYPWIHFASHGHLNSEQPFNSSFELHDNARFTILDLLKANLPNAELAVLSACYTAAVDEDNTPDESISLAAGMQFCGFRGIVGTLWAMADQDGPFLAKEFYKRILHLENTDRPVDFRDAAKVLRAVTKEMRKQDIPLYRWVPFVHIGA
ncbi:TPR-like protein [Auriscalpium vulgare]|uniref:TPR-like protein n=1 Tax=Auriscalpium vulgare TaxID=40419 RepID=A0ACB8RIN4_9AGAM|nr:TPR-like protein [Auriscalpium vulgare]